MIRATCIFVALCLCVSTVAQTTSDFAFFDGISTSNTHRSTPKSSIKKDKNELSRSASLLYGIYRNLISSQDGSTCKFHPTCSAYCRSAVIKNGPIKGMIQTFDRLTRCNGLTPQKYQIDIKRRKLVDHVQ